MLSNINVQKLKRRAITTVFGATVTAAAPTLIIVGATGDLPPVQAIFTLAAVGGTVGAVKARKIWNDVSYTDFDQE